MSTKQNIGSMDAAQKLEFAQAVGSVKLAGGTISSPIDFLDLTLPATYFGFELRFYNLACDNPLENVCFALSADGGANFYNDNSGFTSYRNQYFTVSGATKNSLSYTDSLGITGEVSNLGLPVTQVININPGGVGINPVIEQHGLNANGPGVGDNWAAVTIIALSGASLIEATGRQNLIRFQPYGNGDCNPPTSGTKFTGGSYSLRGFA